MKKLRNLLIGMMVIILGGCGMSKEMESVNQEETSETSQQEVKTEEKENRFYVLLHQEETEGFDDRIEVRYNKQNGCVEETMIIHGYKEYSISTNPYLDENGIPVCGISEEQAKALFRP